MDRIEIYNKYVDPFKINYNCFRFAQYDYEYKGIRYSVYKTRDTGIMFSCATRSRGDMPVSMRVDSEGNKEILIKYEIVGKKTIDGVYIPCVSIELDINDSWLYDSNIILDLSSGNLSNVLYLKIYDRFGPSSRCIDTIIYPTGSKGLKPVFVENILGKNSWRRNIQDILFKYTKSIQNMFKAMYNITEFSFDWIDTSSLESVSSMFYDCSKLRKVTGRIKSNKPIDASMMFCGCSELEEISGNLFAGINLADVNNMFYMCSKLKNKPVNPSNLKKMLSPNSALALYVGCNSSDSERMFKVTQYIMKEYIQASPFLDMEGYFSAGVGTVAIGDIAGIFKDTSLSVLDMANIRFIGDGYGLLDLFGKIWSADNSVGSYSIYKELANEGAKDRLQFLSLPQIVIINKTLKIHNIDKYAYKFIDMAGCSKTEVNTRIQTLKMLDCEDKYAIVV